MTAKKVFKITLVDDHVVLRHALANLVQNFEACTVIDSVDNGLELIESIKAGKVPDLVIMDLNMPVMDGYECAAILQKDYPAIKMLVLTMFDSEIPLIRLLQQGACGFLKKDVHPDELKQAVMTVAEDGFYYAHNSTAKLSNVFRRTYLKQISFDKELLHPLDIEFLKLSATELTYKQIAGVLDLTARHIDNIRDSLFSKLNVKCRVGLAIYAVRNGVVAF